MGDGDHRDPACTKVSIRPAEIARHIATEATTTEVDLQALAASCGLPPKPRETPMRAVLTGTARFETPILLNGDEPATEEQPLETHEQQSSDPKTERVAIDSDEELVLTLSAPTPADAILDEDAPTWTLDRRRVRAWIAAKRDASPTSASGGDTAVGEVEARSEDVAADVAATASVVHADARGSDPGEQVIELEESDVDVEIEVAEPGSVRWTPDGPFDAGTFSAGASEADAASAEDASLSTDAHPLPRSATIDGPAPRALESDDLELLGDDLDALLRVPPEVLEALRDTAEVLLEEAEDLPGSPTAVSEPPPAMEPGERLPAPAGPGARHQRPSERGDATEDRPVTVVARLGARASERPAHETLDDPDMDGPDVDGPAMDDPEDAASPDVTRVGARRRRESGLRATMRGQPSTGTEDSGAEASEPIAPPIPKAIARPLQKGGPRPVTGDWHGRRD